MFRISLCCLLLASLGAADADRLTLVTRAFDTLLTEGIDRWGERETAMWAAVMDARDNSVPRRDVPPTKGVRPWDRAVGGANLYHEIDTIHAMRVLSALTGEVRYREAVDAYLRDTLRYSQHEQTGLLGWGEHLYYEFWLDRTTVCEERRDGKGPAYFQLPHEFLAFTPPWELCWAVDRERTAKAIQSVRWHYQGPDPQVYLFNRHARWDRAEHDKVIMPWIKHAALFSYSFAFLEARPAAAELVDGDLDLGHWRRHTGMLYWKLRDRDTDLLFSCLYHASSPDAGKRAGLISTALYSYWLFRAGREADDAVFRERAVHMLGNILERTWMDEENYYASSCTLDGRPQGRMKAWREGYSSNAYWRLMRICLYLHKHHPDERLATAIDRLITVMDDAGGLPDAYTAQNASDAIAAYLDHYDVSGRPASLRRAASLADRATADLCRHTLPIRQTDDPYYEAKLGCGSLLACLLRLHLRETGTEDPGVWDWSL